MISTVEILFLQWPQFAIGLGNTIWLCVLSAVLSLVLATFAAIPLMSKSVTVRWISQFIVDAIRCIPFLLLAYMLYYCLPVVGLRMSSWTAGLLSLVVYNTAYFSEILRGAWSHLGGEQEESGRAFGFSGIRLFIRIIAPQIFIAAGPLLGNQLIQLIKDSAFLMIITIPELTYMANYVQSRYFIPFATLLLAMFLYWVLCKNVELLVKRLERVAAARQQSA
jgi:polar amino acid transport system permease protein